jgi:magnesium transporter
MLRIFLCNGNQLFPYELEVGVEREPNLPSGQIVWVDVINPTQSEDRYIEKIMDVSIPTREEMQEIEISSRLYSAHGAEFMTINAVIDLDTDEPKLTPISFVLKGQILVTVRYADPRPFSNFITRAQKAGALSVGSGEQIMLGLLEALIDRVADALERAGAKIDALSKEVFHGKSMAKNHRYSQDFERVIVDLGKGGDLLSMVRESLLSKNRVMTYHVAVSDENKRVLKDTRMRIRTIQRDVNSLSEHNAYLASKVSFLLDATLGLINLEQNKIIKIFSIAAVCLMPPTLVASSYGMNFKNIPELDWIYGYPYALALMVITAIVPFILFRKKGWM